MKRLPVLSAVRYLYEEQVGAVLVILAFGLTLGRRLVRPSLQDDHRPSFLLPGASVLLYAGAWSGEMAGSPAFLAFPPLVLVCGLVEIVRFLRRSRVVRKTGRIARKSLVALSTTLLLSWALAWFPESAAAWGG